MKRKGKNHVALLKGVIISTLCLVILLGVLVFLELGTAGNPQPEELYTPEEPTAQSAAVPDDGIFETVPSDTEETTLPDASGQDPVPTVPKPQEDPVPQAPDPKPTDPKPTEPAPTEPKPTEPKPTEPKPTEPVPTEPVPTEPVPTEPTPTEPTPTEPAPTEPPVDDRNIIQLTGEVPAEDDTVTEDTTFGNDDVSAEIPAGVQLEEDTTILTLTITEKDSSDSGVELEAGQAIKPLDVHIDGVSQANTQPITVCLGKILPNGMNIGNVILYHVEDGAANPMTQVLDMAQLTDHNDFYYDPVTGDVTVAMATFSEVTIVSDTATPWEGEYDYTWYTGQGKGEYIIANADQLAAFGRIVGGMAEDHEQYAFAGQTVRLAADINLNDAESENKEDLIFYPIGYHYTPDKNGNGVEDDPYSSVSSFEGIFDGQGHTIANFYQNTWEMTGDYNSGYAATDRYYNDAMGLFGYIVGGTVKNLTIENFSSDGEFAPTGCVTAYAIGSCTFENIALVNCNPRTYNTGVAGIVGWDDGGDDTSDGEKTHYTFKNITIDNSNKISALWGSWDVAAGGLMGYLGKYSTAELINCHVAAQIDVYNDVCGNYQYYWYRYSGMLIGTIDDHTTDANGYTVPNTEGITASGCTVHFGDWNDYYYCELVANSLASYTHDHQFSRLEQIGSVSEIQDESGNWSKTGNYLVIDGDTKTCYHIVKDSEGNLKQHLHTDAGMETVDGATVDKEDKTIVYLPFNQLFTGYGWGVKNIPVYDNEEDNVFPGVTILDRVEANSVIKFKSTGLSTVVPGQAVTLGELFSAKADCDVEIKPEGVQIAVTDLDDTDGIVTAEFVRDETDWAAGTLTFTGTGSVLVTIQDYYFCTPTAITLTVSEPANVDKFDLVFENTDKYLYRVGNKNTVSLGSLFKAIDGAKIGNVTATVTSLDENTNVNGTYTANASDWTQGSIQFSGTGPVKVTVCDDAYANEVTLMLEVVDATNVTAYSGLGNKNSVLLNDITMSSGSSYYLSNATLYGNGFTFDVTDGAYDSGGNISSNYLIYLANAALDNVEVVGAVYTSYGATVKDNYNRPVVLSVGNNTITNCYISNCAAPVRVNGGNLEIVNSTLKGGNFANIDIRNGHVVLDNVTTINQVKGNDTAEDGTVVVGLGVVVYYENVLSTTTVEVKNGITQYNVLSKKQAGTYITDSTASTLVSAMFEDSYSALQYSDGSDTWINTGILSMAETVGDANISDVDGYVEASPSMVGVTGYIHTTVPTATSIAATVPAYATAGQGAIAPAYSFDYTTKNAVAKTEGSNDYCYEDGGTVLISMDEGDSFSWDTSILTATKNGQTLDYTVSMNDTDYTGKSITFNTSGDYTVTYCYTDSNNYGVDENGDITTYPKTYTKTVHISVSVIKPNAKNAEFTFGSDGTAATTVSVGNDTYVMPNVSATSSTIGSTTVSGTTVYYPIVEMVMSDGKTSHTSAWNAYFPVFSGAVTITDYADGGTGSAVTYGASTTSMPSGLSISGDPSTLFKYQSSSSAASTPEVKNNILVYVSPSISANRSEYNTVVTYCYKDNAGATYYYCVGYHAPAQTYSSICVTADTLVTLADGTQKRIDQVTYADQLLVWNFYTGEYDIAPASIIMNHGYSNYTIVTLTFDDGTEVKTINGHGFFDQETNKYVILNEGNVADYIGNSFIKQSGDGYSSARLIDYSVAEEYTESWSILTAKHYNCLLEGMFTLTPAEVEGSPDYLMPFEVGEGLKYDEAEMQADIEQYGLYTYEDFAQYMTYEQFAALGLDIFKISVGKGYITWDDILFLIHLHIS